jgi:hopanoid-associated phosphorylase
MSMLGILCGLQAEADIASKMPQAKVACSAAVPAKARTLARELIANGVTRLMSFGVAGALDTKLPVGSIIIGRKVVSTSGNWACDPAWAESLLRALPMAQAGNVWGSEVLVPTATEKIGLHETTGCAIVDMESQCAAEAANEAGISLAVVRVVCDEATHNVPMLVMQAINPDGSTNYAKVISGLLCAPLQTFDLINVGRNMATALRVLAQVAEILRDHKTNL